jgi:hypothetical protein
MTPFCLVVSGGSQSKDSDDSLLDVVLMFNGGPLGAKGYIERRFLFNTYVPESRHFESIRSQMKTLFMTVEIVGTILSILIRYNISNFKNDKHFEKY